MKSWAHAHRIGLEPRIVLRRLFICGHSCPRSNTLCTRTLSTHRNFARPAGLLLWTIKCLNNVRPPQQGFPDRGNSIEERRTIEMTHCAPSKPGKTFEISGLLRIAGAALVAISTFLSANAMGPLTPTPTTPPAQSFPLSDGSDLLVTGGKAEAVEYQGRKAVRLTTQADDGVFAFLKGLQLQDGTIEADIALKIDAPPGVRMPGFVGIAFRAKTDASHYDMFYLRPGNSHSEDQAMRNHSVQYVAEPGFGWHKLRREWPIHLRIPCRAAAGNMDRGKNRDSR
jgi:hypothetical protein